MIRFISRTGVQTILFILILGCTAPQDAIRSSSQSMSSAASLNETPGSAANRHDLLVPPEAVSVNGSPLVHSVSGYGQETVLLIGGIHGNEPAGTPLLHELAKYLDLNPMKIRGLRVVTVPAANPDGLAAGRRTNAHGVDLNRNYSTANRKAGPRSGKKPLSEPESRYLADLIAYYRPARILSIHQPLACIDWDGPARGLAQALADLAGLPLKKLGARSGSLGSHAGVELGIPIITLELPRAASDLDPDILWERYQEALLFFIRFQQEQAESSS